MRGPNGRSNSKKELLIGHNDKTVASEPIDLDYVPPTKTTNQLQTVPDYSADTITESKARDGDVVHPVSGLDNIDSDDSAEFSTDDEMKGDFSNSASPKKENSKHVSNTNVLDIASPRKWDELSPLEECNISFETTLYSSFLHDT